MIWFRRFVVLILSLILFVCLFAGVLAFSVNRAVAKPANIEAWLNQSGIYSNFVDNVVQQAAKSNGQGDQSNTGSTDVSISDPAVQAAAKVAFSPAVLQKDVVIFLNGNYAWLQKKTATPQFVIDLSTAKQTFAEQVGQAVTTHLASLPVCTTAQLEALTTQDPLAVTCRPATVDPASTGAAVTAQLANGDGFLSNPVITPTSLSTKGNNQPPSQPYYDKFSFAPKAYKAATEAPWALAGLALLCIIGIFFIAPTKRRGVRRVGVVLFEVGILLVAAKFAVDYAFKKAEDHVFNSTSVGPLQHSLTTFAGKLESQLVNTNMYFGIGFLVVALIIFIVFMSTRKRKGKHTPEEVKPEETKESEATTEQPAKPQPSRPPKRPRLIQ